MMNRATKGWLFTAAILLLIGLILLGTAFSLSGWRFSALDTTPYETNIHTIQESFTSIDIEVDESRVIFAPSDDGTCRVECYEWNELYHSVAVQEGVLVIRTIDERPLHRRLGFHFSSPQVTVYLPQAEYTRLAIKGDTGDVFLPKAFCFESVDIALTTGDVDLAASVTGALSITTSTGDVRLTDSRIGSLAISLSTGSVAAVGLTVTTNARINSSTGDHTLTNVTVQDLALTASTGAATLSNVIASGEITIKRDTGSVRLEGCDAATLLVETDTGDVTGSLLTGKSFLATTSSGRVNVPTSAEGGRCEIRTSTGDITITVP